jgi:ParB-like chromosome segregation protein Spo0J
MAKAKIAAQLKPLAVQLDSLNPDPKNPRLHTARNLEAIAGSLKKFGQVKPIIVQKKGMIVRAGNGTVDAARSLGWTELAAVIVDMTDEKAQQLAVADNRTAELADWNHENLVELMTGWDSLDIPGFSEAEINGLMSSMDAEMSNITGSSMSSTLDITGGTGTVAGYTPAVEPPTQGAATTEEDVDRAAAILLDMGKSNQSSVPVVCPECAHEFRIQG